MTQSPRFSIVISTLNCGDKLPQALQSIQSQDYDGYFETVVIDGASTDNTLEVIEGYSHMISFFVSEADRGIYDAWNKGISNSIGEWILFLGSDDMLLPNTLSVYSKYLDAQSSNVEYISARVRLRFSSGHSCLVGRPWRWLEFRHFMKTAHVGSLHSRSLFDRYGLFSLNYSVCSDYEFFMRIGSALKSAYINEPLAVMSAGGVSQSSLRPLFQTREIKRQYAYIPKWRIDFDFLYSILVWMLSSLKHRFELGCR